MISLREKQLAALRRMLAFNHRDDFAASSEFADQWKVLVYDEAGRDIISPLMNVGQLRQSGVTLHMMLAAEREQIADVAAVYFMQPTEANVTRLAQDCKRRLYRGFYVNFTSRIERPLMESLAQELIQHNVPMAVSQIYDQYLDFVALEPSLFTLNRTACYRSLNKAGLNEAQVMDVMGSLCIGLVSVLQNMGAVPIIRCAPNGPAEMLARLLCDTLREYIYPRSSSSPALFKETLALERTRPLLLLVDRNEDMVTPLHHTATYQALIDDLLSHRLNRVQISVTREGNAPQTKSYDLNSTADSFFNRMAGAPFPEAVEANEKELSEAKAQESQLRRSGHTESKDPNTDSTLDLASAVDSLPEILARRSTLETHTSILHAVMSHVAAREIPTYFELEQKLVQSVGGINAATKRELLTLLRDSTKGSVRDKLRLLAVATMVESASSSVVAEHEGAFRDGCAALGVVDADTTLALGALRHLRQMRTFSLQRGAGLGDADGGMLRDFVTTAATGLLQKAAAMFTKFTPVHVTRLVDRLSEGKEDDGMLYLDPRVRPNEPAASRGETGKKYSEVIVFMIGGGCYSEYQNLQDYVATKRGTPNTAGYGAAIRSVVYGCSDLINADKLLDQLQTLA